ncbi:MAG: 3-hydroxyacyl-CoA dehydrogenase family protein [bacterium]|nr:3-hydroxyacyl-CoA dehydrogenase family protein [bacterium]
MDYTQRLENVTVLGAAGKMGSGILLLTAMEMADLSLMPENKDRNFTLNALDVCPKALSGLMKFIRVQVTKAAEKKTVALRKTYADNKGLVENGEIIEQYVFDVMNVIRPTTSLEAAYKSTLVFEAIKEDPALKVKILSLLDRNNEGKPWFFTNTSSIPISELDAKAELGGRVVGFHFYNPPAVQKLVELIKGEHTLDEVEEFAKAYAKKLRKKIVPSNDYAGFIGNGHFMRDALHGIHEVERLSADMSFAEAVYTINKVSQDYLIRPMGIFQLVDYVGLDVCQYIMSVMNPHLADENLHSELLDKYIGLDVKGGQFHDGSQKDGFLKYEKGRPSAIYDPEKKEYVAISEIQAACDERLGVMPEGYVPWKAVIGNPKKDEVFEAFFKNLNAMDTMGALLAKDYGKRSKEISLKLVADNVAQCEKDVNTVLLTGFYHSFGPINEYFN